MEFVTIQNNRSFPLIATNSESILNYLRELSYFIDEEDIVTEHRLDSYDIEYKAVVLEFNRKAYGKMSNETANKIIAEDLIPVFKMMGVTVMILYSHGYGQFMEMTDTYIKWLIEKEQIFNSVSEKGMDI